MQIFFLIDYYILWTYNLMFTDNWNMEYLYSKFI